MEMTAAGTRDEPESMANKDESMSAEVQPELDDEVVRHTPFSTSTMTYAIRTIAANIVPAPPHHYIL